MSTTGRWIASLALALPLGAAVGCDKPDEPRAEATFPGKPFGVSGLAAMKGLGDGETFLAVHDNKDKKPPLKARVSLVRVVGKKVTREEFEWPAAAVVPIDLEDVAAVPGAAGDAILMESSGRLFHVHVRAAGSAWALDVVDPAPAPLPRWAGKDGEKEGGEYPEFEGFALTTLGGKTVALWGERGTRAAAGTVFFAPFDAAKGVDTDGLGALPVRVAEPTGTDVRDVSAIAVDAAGVVFFASADDEGDDGPFDSVVYRLGPLRASPSGLTLEREPEPVAVRRPRGHKVEGLVVAGEGKFALGGDDENLGGWFQLE